MQWKKSLPAPWTLTRQFWSEVLWQLKMDAPHTLIHSLKLPHYKSPEVPLTSSQEFQISQLVTNDKRGHTHASAGKRHFSLKHNYFNILIKHLMMGGGAAPGGCTLHCSSSAGMLPAPALPAAPQDHPVHCLHITAFLTKLPELTPTPWHQVTLGIQQDAAFVPCTITCNSAKHYENWQVLCASIKNGIMRSKGIFPLLPMFNKGKISI